MKKNLLLVLILLMTMCLISCATKKIEDDYYNKYVHTYNLLLHIPQVPQAPVRLENMDWQITPEGLFTLPSSDARRLATWNEYYDIYLYDMETFKQQLDYIRGEI